MSSPINFYNQNIPYTLKNKNRVRTWITRCAANERKKIGEITYMFGDDNYILETNRKYLNHDYLTDIITFDYSSDDMLCGDIAISIERVRENAKKYGVSIEKELLRVLIHGILHLCGYKDKSPKEEAAMRGKEDECIRKYYSISL